MTVSCRSCGALYTRRAITSHHGKCPTCGHNPDGRSWYLHEN